LSGEGGGKHLASFYAFTNVLKDRTKVGVSLAFSQELESGRDGQAGVDQGEKLLVEDDEFALLDLLAARAGHDAVAEETLGADGVDVKTLFGEAISQVCLRVRPLRLFENPAAFVGHFYKEFSHILA
jgi:hypothetical protein